MEIKIDLIRLKLLTYNLFEKFEKPVVTWDFDGVLHVGQHFIPHGTDLQKSNKDPKAWGVSEKMVDLLNKTSSKCNCIIVSGRPIEDTKLLRIFADVHHINVSGIFCLDKSKKAEKIIELGSIRHYDDESKVFTQLQDLAYKGEFFWVEDGEIKERI